MTPTFNWDADINLPPAPAATAERDRILADLTRRAGERFRREAQAHILRSLEGWPCGRPGEALTLACREAGIAPPGGMDDRAFGPVFLALLKRGQIVRVGTVRRTRGHHTSGGSVYALRQA